jgi:hypothetical protein
MFILETGGIIAIWWFLIILAMDLGYDFNFDWFRYFIYGFLIDNIILESLIAFI